MVSVTTPSIGVEKYRSQNCLHYYLEVDDRSPIIPVVNSKYQKTEENKGYTRKHAHAIHT
jgi:hypothetical protein